MPFELEGNKLGRLERLVVNREAPKKVSSVDLEVKLDDSLLVQGLAGCRLAANLESDSSKSGDINFRAHRLEDQAFFFCAKSDSGLVEFGTVKLTPGDVTVPLLVPVSLAEQMRAGNWGDHDDADSADVLAERAESLADKAEASGGLHRRDGGAAGCCVAPEPELTSGRLAPRGGQDACGVVAARRWAAWRTRCGRR